MINILLCILLVFTSSCASLFNGTSEKIHLRSDVPGAKLYLDEQYLGEEIGAIQVSKKNLKNVTLTAKKDGCTSVSTSIETRFDSMTLFGLLIDLGIISILVIDWGLNGAVFEAERTGYVLNPDCSLRT